jgi:hypothetical protein
VDEAPNEIQKLRRVINLCWANGNRDAAPASLLISCRTDRDVRNRNELVSKWISTPQPDFVAGIGYVEVDDFTPNELEELAVLLGGEPERRIHPTTLAEGGLSLRPVREEILSLLRHPVVWGVYAVMTETERSTVLDGEVTLLNHLARKLCERFRRRCHNRRFWRDGALLQPALVAISQATMRPDIAQMYTQGQWDENGVMFLDRSEVKVLFSECLSYGLVERESKDKWRWSHRIVAEYLAHAETEEWK